MANAVMKRWWEVDDADIQKMTDATVWCEAGFDNFRGGGFSNHFVTRAEMPATMIRLNLVKGLGPVLQIAEGWTVKLPDEVTDTLMERTNPTGRAPGSPALRRQVRQPPFEAPTPSCRTGGSNHGARSPYGHVGADLITLCSMLRIPVSACTTSPIRTSSVRPHGTHSAWIRKARTTVPAPPTARCTRISAEFIHRAGACLPDIIRKAL